MTMHTCLLCLGSNIEPSYRLSAARSALLSHFPHIRFSEEMITKAIGSGFLSPFHNQMASLKTSLPAEQVRAILKSIEQGQGRLPEDKAQGIVKLDIDLLMYDDIVLKSKDMEREFVMEGMKSLDL